MKKQRRRRAFDSGQHVSPLLNELEWLDDEPVEKPAADKKKKSPQPKRRSNRKTLDTQQKAKVKESGALAQASAVTAPDRHHGTMAPPLLLLNNRKPQPAKSNWARELFGYDSWAAQQADQIVDAIQSFQLGLDGIMKDGEHLNVMPAREQAMIIDITPEPESSPNLNRNPGPNLDPEPEPDQEPSMESRAEGAAVETKTEDTAARGGEQQLYGLIPFRFQPFEERIDVSVTFEQPFESDRYVLVATSDQPGCHTVISKKTPASALIRLIRSLDVPYLEGELNWIAFGSRA
jgi:hypothetical protein